MATTLIKPQVVVNQTKAQLEEKIESIAEGALPPYLKSMFSDLASANLQNAQILYNFLLIGHLEQNLALRTSLNHMQILYYSNRYLAYKPFERITKDDVSSYLASLRRPETDDPTHKWIGTHNVRQMILTSFLDGYIIKMKATVRSGSLLHACKE